MQLRRVLLIVFTILAIASVPTAAAAQSNGDQPLKIAIKDLGLTFNPETNAVVQSQRQHQGIGIGALIGPVFDKFNSDEEGIDFSTKTGWQFSLFIGGNRPGRVGVATEISLLRRKTQAVDDPEEVKFNTLQVPVFVRVNVGSQNLDRASVYVKFGPAFDVVLKAERAGEDLLDLEEVERFQVDLIGGVGVEITRFIVEARYIHGLRTVNTDFQEVGKLKYKAFAILFGVRFN
jgi:hypothetical protein